MAGRRPGSLRPVPAQLAERGWNALLRQSAPQRPRPLPIGAYTARLSVPVGGNGIAQGIVSASGAATVTAGPQGYGTRWYPNQVSIASQTGAADTSTCAFYFNVAGPGGFLGQSYAGGGDQLGWAVPEMQPGDLLYAVWAGAHPGDWVQMTVIGQMTILGSR